MWASYCARKCPKVWVTCVSHQWGVSQPGCHLVCRHVHRRGEHSDIFVSLCLIDSQVSLLYDQHGASANSTPCSHSLTALLRSWGVQEQTWSHRPEEGWETLHLWVMNSLKLSIQWNVLTCHYSLPPYLPILPLHARGKQCPTARAHISHINAVPSVSVGVTRMQT